MSQFTSQALLLQTITSNTTSYNVLIAILFHFQLTNLFSRQEHSNKTSNHLNNWRPLLNNHHITFLAVINCKNVTNNQIDKFTTALCSLLHSNTVLMFLLYLFVSFIYYKTLYTRYTRPEINIKN